MVSEGRERAGPVRRKGDQGVWGQWPSWTNLRDSPTRRMAMRTRRMAVSATATDR